MKKLILISLISAMAGAVHAAEKQSPSAKNAAVLAEFNTIQGIIYKTVNGESLDMILFLPGEEFSEKMPVMLYTHGGGWGGGDKFKLFGPVFLDTLKILLDNGIACAAIEYRLTRVGKSTAVDCVTDCKDAARFLVKNAEAYHLDPGRMGVWGGSAGGHLALMTGLADNRLFPGDENLADADPVFRCIASYYPAVSFLDPELFKDTNFQAPARFIPLLGGLPEDHPDVAELISPVQHLKKGSPPVLLLHGDNDAILPIAHSLSFIKIAKEKGSDVKLLTVEGGGHSFTGEAISPSMPEINRIAADFIIANIKEPLGDR